MDPMQPATTQLKQMESAWQSVAERLGAYTLALPGCPTFICQPALCDAHCCRAFSVNLGEQEVARMQAASGQHPVTFLESEDGRPITLPMAQPYLLKRAENHCAQLSPDLACGQYEGRPNACRLYPHFVIFVDEQTGRPVSGDQPGMRLSIERLHAGAALAPYVPLLVRHVECPGFTGPPMNDAAWRTLFAETAQLQSEFWPSEADPPGVATGRKPI
jgi:Fe-S-cluster containining protein